MKPCHCCVCMVLIGWTSVTGATDIQQWRDPDGQVHYGDRAPPGVAATRMLRLHNETTVTTGGLRPAERQAIERIKRRTQKQRKTIESAQRGLQHKQTQTHKQCQQARDNFRNARKDENFNKYALYLRRHCW